MIRLKEGFSRSSGQSSSFALILEYNRFTIRTGHNSLHCILNLETATGRLVRWRLRLLGYKFDFEHRQGMKHQAADALSQPATAGLEQSTLKNDIPTLVVCPNVDDDDLHPDDRDDIATIFEAKPGGIPTVLAISDDEHREQDSPIFVDTFLYEQKRDADCTAMPKTVGVPGSAFATDKNGLFEKVSKPDGASQIVVPLRLRPRIFYLGHYLLMQGHQGGRRMYETLRKTFYWRFMANKSYQTVRNGASCAKNQGTMHPHSNLL